MEIACYLRILNYFFQTNGQHITKKQKDQESLISMEIPYTDMSTMGVGTNILGYCNEEVDNAVQNAISHGNMSSLNCEEEVILAERLVELHPWSEMVRFARTGGEANAMAVRIARAASGREKIAVCGYHGWHDWYLASNLGDNSRLEDTSSPWP